MIFYLLMIISITLMLIAIILMIITNNNINKLVKQNNQSSKTIPKRTHATGSQANFSNVLSGRTSVYDKYKNNDGLYEPVKGKHGIDLKTIKKKIERII